MKTDVFQLQIVAIKDIIPHEEYDIERSKPLAEKIRKSGYISNPILVTAIDFDHKKYLQLDGMNRLTAFKMLGLKTIITQIVDYNSQDQVELSSWVHMVNKDLKDFLEFIKKKTKCTIKIGKMEDIEHRYIRGENVGRLCTLVDKNGHVYLIYSNGKMGEKVVRINKLVSFYSDKIIRDVLPPKSDGHDVRMIFRSHTESKFMVVFPTFTRHQIVDVIKYKVFFPSGITRHIIHRRCLDLKVPITIFQDNKSLKVQNQELEKMLSRRAFRIYEEATVYFE
ncbi:hypothetical protein COV53_03850 [Candidatus Gottesmanbacteria bacterium CG11_big_fil_rev_8_21_14_0_20_37_11]|uniref:ParB-like N-terminal domain-containing protein n=3 Tax=Candidatus Gottesmaniibacteriota TaxID=1752720 RepID=A0A2M7RSN4_9BACT|nr:MAG: hypothetical protein AUJ73_00360 [Candidatus Gottesmanbacteria bacterium CG1_02_37_22]PIP33159.1 MAG: hypothetical protein COX23_00845 [Candidatus Gottesmanbacteria bacterium CG23_combo_of_CG06-09_8_20_14_all_37_19]PIR08279.1 MAG: hypothetical protein COV53_03850 [Candidatus Gottesmanbacteria bacterium CG11_big_fil_rev_8_21_14_0_20_37_11]PIZ03302.1 MAG: hypothetical protein COY59_00225 [Candidatus Gottesmanbacteria bacterium CG_4_10_14_0_8_um_filter_37_24]